MPPLPEGQRWVVGGIMGFVTVKLQERRWWGWRTIADSIERADTGASGVRQCVDRILRRDEYARAYIRRAEEERQRRAEIPYGVTNGRES